MLLLLGNRTCAVSLSIAAPSTYTEFTAVLTCSLKCATSDVDDLFEDGRVVALEVVKDS
jgi:hypothetical protein